MNEKRRAHEPPAAVAQLGWRYHHLGIPCAAPHPDEQHLDHLGLHVRGFDTSPCGIEWMRFEPHCRVPDIVRTTPHVAFAVDDLEEALAGREILIEPNSPSDGVRVAFILESGAPVELLEFRRPASPPLNEDPAVRPQTRSAPDARRIVTLLVQCWSTRTSSLWSPESPARGQCGVTALVLQDHFGGEILKTPVGPSWHFYNRIGEVRLDATAGQFPAPVGYLDLLSSREEAFADTNRAQYEELSRSFAAALSREGG